MPSAAAVPKLISVGGGKGGVGKSLVAANLAVAMAQQGARVVLVDGDLGAANQHTLFGIDRPGPTLQALFDRTIERVDQALVPTGVAGLRLLPGTGAVVGAANIPAAQKLKLVRQVRRIDADVVVIDVGAGVAFNTLDLYVAAELRLVVVTPELTSMQNAYAFAKGAVFRELEHLATTEAERRLLLGSSEAAEATRRMGELLARVDAVDGSLGARVRETLSTFGARLVGNLVFEARDRGAVHAMARMMSDFLGIEAPVLGVLRSSKRVHESVRARRPHLLESPHDENSGVLRDIAAKLLREPTSRLREARAHPDDGLGAAAAGEPTSLPEAIERYTRKHVRVAVRAPATLRVHGTSAAVQVHDISPGGALLELHDPPPPDTPAVLVVTALDGAPALPCVVRHGRARFAGVQFDDTSALVRGAVERVIERFGLDRDGEPRPVERVD